LAKCGICGKENPEEAVKCKQCNALLRRPAEAPVPAAAPEVPGSGRKLALLAGGGIGVAAVLAAIVYFAFLRGPAEAPAQPAAAPRAPATIEQQIADDIRRMEQAQEQERAELALDGLYAPASFATREAIMQHSFAVREVEERDASHERQWQTWRAEVLRRIEQSGKSPQERVALAKKVEMALAASEAARVRARAISKEWARVTVSLYDYAGTNAEHIDARGGELHFRNPEVEAGFRSRMRTAQRLQEEIGKVRLQAAQARRSKLKEAGIEVPE
jgi:hypothetical protein